MCFVFCFFAAFLWFLSRGFFFCTLCVFLLFPCVLFLGMLRSAVPSEKERPMAKCHGSEDTSRSYRLFAKRASLLHTTNGVILLFIQNTDGQNHNADQQGCKRICSCRCCIHHSKQPLFQKLLQRRYHVLFFPSTEKTARFRPFLHLFLYIFDVKSTILTKRHLSMVLIRIQITNHANKNIPRTRRFQGTLLSYNNFSSFSFR